MAQIGAVRCELEEYLIKMTRLLIAIILPILALTVSGISFSQNPDPRGDPIVVQIVQLDHAECRRTRTGAPTIFIKERPYNGLRSRQHSDNKG